MKTIVGFNGGEQFLSYSTLRFHNLLAIPVSNNHRDCFRITKTDNSKVIYLVLLVDFVDSLCAIFIRMYTNCAKKLYCTAGRIPD
uniref:Uncharacterized protein n=1 Tax=Parascaris univalens TaxID=6257 RepID=A0A915AA36_PARUN